MKSFNVSNRQTEVNSSRGSQESSSLKTLNVGSIGVSSGNINNMCNICSKLPKNGVFNHGKIGHIFSCYPCTKNIWKKSNKCPICNTRVQYITKLTL